MTDRFNPETTPGPINNSLNAEHSESGSSGHLLWREYALGENGRLCISTNLRNHLLEKGIKVNELGRMVAADIETISEYPHGVRSVDPLTGTDMSQQRWVNEMTKEIADVVGFPVVVKRSLGIEREDLRGQFEKMATLESEINKALEPEQKKIFGVAKVLAVVSIGAGENQQEYLFMEKVEGDQMGVREKLPNDLRLAFDIKQEYGQTFEMEWNDLRYALLQKGLDFDDFKPRNVIIQKNEHGRKKYVVLDQGGKYENDGWYLM